MPPPCPDPEARHRRNRPEQQTAENVAGIMDAQIDSRGTDRQADDEDGYSKPILTQKDQRGCISRKDEGVIAWK